MYELDERCFALPFRFSRRAMRGFAEADGAITVLAEEDAQLVGFCIAQVEHDSKESEQPDARTGYVVTLDVAVEWRRRGLARRLMHELELRAQADGAGSMALHVFAGNLAAVHLYESLGYECSGVAADFYAAGLDGLVYRKVLAADTMR
jgi:[ribosomal protein S18]-alanine N-acetyltransferase